MKTLLFKPAALLLVTLFLTSCGTVDNVDKMEKTTGELKNTTEDMNTKTDRLSQKADSVSESANAVLTTARSVYRDARQGGAAIGRMTALNNLTNTDLSFELKFKDAAAYFQAFEFQLWENIFTDDEAKRQSLLASAAEEFMATFRGVINGKRESPNPLSKDKDMQNVLALAAMADQINDLQIESALQNKFAPTSILELIVNSLKLLKQADDGREIPKYAQKILVFEDEARYLLEARYTVYAAMILDKLFNATQLGLLDKLTLLLKSELVVDFASLNSVEINELTNKYIGSAIYARTVMSTLGTPIYMNKVILGILKKATFKNDLYAGNAKIAAIERFKKAYSIFICGTVCDGKLP